MRSIDRRIVGLGVPALGALAADPLLSLVDTAFVARLGTVELGALGVDTALFSFAFFAFNFLAYATTPMVARSLGRGDRQGAGRVVVQAATLAVVLGAAVGVALVAGARLWVGVMQASPELVDPAVSYLRVRGLAAPAVLLVLVGHGAFRGFQDTRTPLIVTLAINGLNAALDPLFLFGFDMGLAGAAWATVIAQWVGVVWFGVLIRRRGTQAQWSWRLPGWKELAPMVRTGGVITLRTLFLTATLTIATAVAASIGATQVAAHQVVQQTWFLLAMTVDALAIAAQALVADELGRHDRPAAGAVAGRLWWWGGGVGVVLAIGLLWSRDFVAAAFGPTPEVTAAIESALVVAAAMQPIAALVFVADGVFLGLLRVRYLAYSTGAGFLAGVALLTLTVALGWGLLGVWWAIAAMVAARLVVLAFSYPRALAEA